MTSRSTTQPAQTVNQRLKDRGAEATRYLRDALHLAPDLNDLSILSTAVAEEAALECGRNSQFATGVRQRYDEMMALRTKTRKPVRIKPELPPLVPVGHMQPGEHIAIDPFAPPDPGFLTRVYGRAQLGRALVDYTLDMLKQTAAQVEANNPGTKPANRGRKDALIAYIVEYSNSG